MAIDINLLLASQFLLLIGIFLFLFVCLRIAYRNFQAIVDNLSREAEIFVFGGLFSFVFTAIFIPFIKNQTLIFGALSVSFGFLSVGLGLLAYRMGQESDRKMVQIANEKVLDVESIFEDRRLDLLRRFRYLENKSNNLHHVGMDNALRQSKEFDLRLEWRDFNQAISFNLWKSATDIQRADVLEEWTEDGYKNRLLIFTAYFFSDLLNYISFGYILTEENVEHINIINDLIENYNILGLNEEDSAVYLSVFNELIRNWEER